MEELEELREELSIDIERVKNLIELSCKTDNHRMENLNRGYLMAIIDYKKRVEEMLEDGY
jgi:hypothetical protein